MKVYFCIMQIEDCHPILLEHSIGGGIHFLMDAANRNEETVMRWDVARSAESYDRGFTDEQLPLQTQNVFQGRRTRYLIDMIQVVDGCII